MTWTLNNLKDWDNRICKIAESHNLDWFNIVYETCDYYEMIGNMSYHGLPTHYSHWSHGKAFEVTHQLYNLGMEGLPYELIINSDPSIAYLMKENPLYLQVLIMAHCVGHSDFFKNNRMFKATRPNTVLGRFRNAKKRIQSYIEDPSIGIELVEEIIDAAKAFQFQMPRRPILFEDIEEKRQKQIREIKNKIKNKRSGGLLDKTGKLSSDFLNIKRLPIEAEYDVLGFVIQYSELDSWAKDILEIIRDEGQYFIPQMQTKIMNEGWACFWHFKILHELNLSQSLHIPFLKMHNQVVRPHIGRINPYHVGFHLFNKIEERFGLDECFLARDVHHDVSFLRQYLTEEDCQELGLFSFSKKKDGLFVDEVSDADGWKSVKEELINQVGMNGIPTISIESVNKDGTLILWHDHDGRDLKLEEAEKVVNHMETIWAKRVKMITIIEDEPFEISN